MKKTILIAVGAFVVGLLISPFIGMAISSTRDLILGMAPKEAILVLANRIDEGRQKNLEQEQKISKLEDQNNQQLEQLSEVQKREWEEKKQNCEQKIKEAQGSLADQQKNLQSSLKYLHITESGENCRGGDDCYDRCVELGNNKKRCKRNYEGTLKTRQEAVQEEKENVLNAEKDLTDIKNECAQYVDGSF